MLKCPDCGGKTKVTGKYRQKGERMGRVLRYRRCTACGKIMLSHEVYSWEYKGKPKPEPEQPAKRFGPPCDATVETCLHCPLETCVLESGRRTG